jgi:hypothetical protein
MVKQQQRYADIVRQRMKTRDNSTGEPLSIREVAKRLGYSYEHVRKTVVGEPVASREFNDALAQLLNLDPDVMWNTAQREKMARRFRELVPNVAPPADDRLAELWPKLTKEEQHNLIKIAEAYVLQHEVNLPFAVGM